MAYAVLATYVFLMCIIFIFCMIELKLAFKYLRYKRNNQNLKSTFPENIPQEEHPFVTIQLPVYNEKYVVKRLMDACAVMDYPASRFEIQMLDDSNDETSEIISKRIEFWMEKGIQIHHVQREDRSGFKAGALQYGMQSAKGDFFVVFDADFLPNPDFLRQTLIAFEDPAIGVVQTRWEHINEDYSMLTKVQAFTLDVHFAIEHVGRNSSGYYMNFNGTAGVWRKEAIEDAGGWSADTITEDLDLSYRSQLAGWKFKYLYHVGAPAELPAEMPGYKSQQYRWNKGGAEVAIKLLPRIFKSSIPFSLKLHALHHLLSSSMYLIIFLAIVLSVPLIILKDFYPEWIMNYSSVFFAGFLAIAFVYYLAYIINNDGFLKRTFGFVFHFLTFMAVSLGMAYHNATAVISAFFGIKSPFIRTAKYNLKDKSDGWFSKKYTIKNLNTTVVIEGLLVLYFLFAVIFGYLNQEWGLFPLHVAALFGYSFVFYYTIRHTILAKG